VGVETRLVVQARKAGLTWGIDCSNKEISRNSANRGEMKSESYRIVVQFGRGGGGYNSISGLV